MSAVTLDPSRLLTLCIRAARKGSVRLIFQNADETAHSIADVDFALLVKKWLDGDALIELTIGTGLTIQGADENELLIEFDEDQTDMRASTYYWELLNLTAVKTWLNGDFKLHNGKFDGVESMNVITINPDGTDILIIISDSTGGSQLDGGNL